MALFTSPGDIRLYVVPQMVINMLFLALKETTTWNMCIITPSDQTCQNVFVKQNLVTYVVVQLNDNERGKRYHG